MKQNSTVISSVQLDQINVSLVCEEIDNLKALLIELTQSNQWRDLKPMRGYSHGELEKHTGIKLFWNDNRPDSKHIMNGKLLCIIPGGYLKTLNLFMQQTILKRLNKAYKVSQLHLKAEVSYPPISINSLDSWVKLADKTKGNSTWYEPYRSNVLIDSSSKQSGINSPTLCFPKNYRGKKATVVYDPLFKHGIENAQHWEYRVSDEYIDRVLIELLVDYSSEHELATAIKEIVFDSIDFRVGKDRLRQYEAIRQAPLAF
jgi:hypothetical protein